MHFLKVTKNCTKETFEELCILLSASLGITIKPDWESKNGKLDCLEPNDTRCILLDVNTHWTYQVKPGYSVQKRTFDGWHGGEMKDEILLRKGWIELEIIFCGHNSEGYTWRPYEIRKVYNCMKKIGLIHVVDGL